MKLLTKTSYYYLLLTCILFLTGSTLFYYYLSGLLNEEIHEQLEIEKKRALISLEETGTLPSPATLSENDLVFVPAPAPIEERLSDTLLLSPILDELLPYRCLFFPVEINGKYYTGIIKRPLIEKDDLLETLAKSLGVFSLLIVVSLFIINRRLSFILWKPFYQTLQHLKSVALNKPQHFPAVKTTEFDELHTELNRMFDRLQDQFRNLKEFTENASHELQTPLAIIRNKLELLLQIPNFQEQEINTIREAYESTNRLSKLLDSLLLLSKIENRHFMDSRPVELKPLVQKMLDFFGEMISFKQISLETRPDASPVIEMDMYLAQILLSNIIGNAVKHCPKEGILKVDLSDQTLVISNTGPVLTLEEDQLFTRFSKGSLSTESSGLGLAIAKQICELYGFRIAYQYNSPFHVFSIQF